VSIKGIMRKYKKISIVIPVYNEEKYFEKNLRRVLKANTIGLEKEIIIVDDYSTDNTRRIIKKIKLSKNIQYYFKDKNEGKGAAIKIGIRKSSGDILLIQDSDLEYNPKDYPSLIKPILEGKTDVVYGSRTLGISKFGNKYSSFFYYIGGRLLTLFMNVLYGISLTDQPTGYKVFTKNVLPLLVNSSRYNDFSYEIEVTAKLAKNKISIFEVPISYNPRSVKEGKKINIMDFVKSIFVGFKYKFN